MIEKVRFVERTEIKKIGKALLREGAPFDDPCRDTKDSELDSFFLCACVCFVSSLVFFLYLSRDKNTRKREMRLWKEEGARALGFSVER